MTTVTNTPQPARCGEQEDMFRDWNSYQPTCGTCKGDSWAHCPECYCRVNALPFWGDTHP